MKISTKLLAFLCFILLIGIVTGGALYLVFFMPNPEHTRLRAVGVITPETIKVRPSQIWTDSEVELWSEGGSNLTDVVEAALKSDTRLFPSTEGNTSKVKVIVLPSTSMSAITDSTGVFLQKDVAVYSGNFIYLPAEAGLLLRNPDRLMDNLVAGLLYSSAFNLIDLTEVSVYDINQSPLLADYVSTIGASSETATRAAQIVQDKWVSPYPTKTAEYSSISEVCFQLGSNLELMLCESVLQQNGQQALLPPKSSQFFESRGLQNFSSFKALGRITPIEIKTRLNPLELNVSKIKFNNWGFNDMREASYLISTDNYFKGLTAENLTSVQNSLSELGFELVLEAEKSPNTQFGGSSYYNKYRKGSPIGDIFISVRVLDTATLNSDCIVEGVGELFCSDDAISRDSGLFIQIIVGEKLKYA